MARYVHEIMNAELFFLRPEDAVDNATLGILSLGITAAPVVDAEGHPAGVVSLRDLVAGSGETVADRMSSPAMVIEESAEIKAAAEQLAAGDRHRLFVVDGEGRAIGVVSSLDLLRALLGVPERHPAAFPHLDAAGVSWSDPFVLDLEQTNLASAGAGIFVLSHDEVGKASVPLWAEASSHLRARLHELLAAPHEQTPWLRRILENDVDNLRVRVASVLDTAARAASLARAKETIASASGLPVPSE